MNWHSTSATKMLGALALVLVALAGWFLALGPQTTALAQVQTTITDTRDSNDTLRAQLSSLRAQQKALPQTRRGASVLAEKFPPTADQPGLFRAVTAAATDAGIPAKNVTALTPTPPIVGATDPAAGVQLPSAPSEGDLAAQTVDLSVQASYDDTQQLLENLEQMPRAYLISGVTLATDPESNTFTTTITGQMFVMPPAVDPDQAKRSS